MASKFIADLSDPQLNEKVGSWTNGERYRLGGMDLVQDSNDGKLAVFTVEGIELDDTEEAASTEPEAPAKAPPKKTVTVYPK